MYEQQPGQYDSLPFQEATLAHALMDADHWVDRQAIEQEATRLIFEREAQAEVPVMSQERKDNARTALMEALTASGHLSRIEIIGSLEEINAQVLARLLNGFSHNLPEHEQQRRFAEICEELRIQAIHEKIANGILAADTEVLTISDFADFDMNTIYGYRASNRKGMVRSTSLVSNQDGSYTRVIEQVSRSNGTADTTHLLMEAAGIERLEGMPDDVATLHKQSVYSRESVVEGVVAVQRQLDKYAGPNVLYGDDITQDHSHVGYTELREVSREREAQLELYIDKLAAYDEKLGLVLQAGLMTFEQYQTQYGEQVRQMLRAICTLAPSYAEACFGQEAAVYYSQASDLVARGNIDAAMEILGQARGVEQTVTFCGSSISKEQAKNLGIETDELGEVVSEGKEKWVWRKGVCRVDSCPTRPGQTEVGPCEVCRTCQHWFDKNRDPAKLYGGARKVSKAVTKKLDPAHKRSVFNQVAKV